MTTIQRATALAAILLLLPLAQVSAATPRPKATVTKPAAMPKAVYSKVPLHTEFVVEVNKLGQIVRVKSGKSCKDLKFNAITYGNVLQMWIRHPDGSAQVGLYRVTYDYDPHRLTTDRRVSLISAGGDWANLRGAANEMSDEAIKENADALKAPHYNLPSSIKVLRASPKPTSHP